MSITQRVRIVLALAQAGENGRPVSFERLAAEAEAVGLARHQVEIALPQLAREGLAQEIGRGWILRPAPLSPGVCLEAAARVRLHE